MCGAGDWAHPRECGADTEQTNASACQPGSSPRVRGRRSAGTRTFTVLGLIPASAGQTANRIPLLHSPGLIPASAGQTSSLVAHTEPCSGSSPRVRGRRAGTQIVMQSGRLIPASAGQTSTE